MVRIGIDVGGTFTDFVMADTTTGALSYFKVPSSPEDPSVAIAQGTREMLEQHSVPPGEVEYFGHGTTVATNMVIERRGVRTGLVTTRGFRDVLAIGRQTRPSLYDHGVAKPAPLVWRRHRLEVGERLDATGAPLRGLDESELEQCVRELLADGVESLAISFLHSYRNPDHEEQARRVVERVAPGLHVSISYEVLPEFREFERTSTTVLNAYVAPRMHHYLERLRTRLKDVGLTVDPLTFHSNGGLMPLKTVARLPVLSCLSGPAAGVIGSTVIGAAADLTEIITFDVGGTSTDVSLITGGRPGFTSDRLVAGYPVKMPMIDIHVVGAGGGSIARLDDVGALKVGPDSAGAVPGPVAFGKGGTVPTLTDANIVLGRLNPATLLGGRMKVDRERAAAVIDALIARPIGVSVEEAAHGILRIATANMSRAIRTVSTEHGHDPADFTLFAFGGAGPLHAAEVAQECGIGGVLVPQEPGTMCARGILLADVSRDFVRTQLAPLDDENWRRIQGVLRDMCQEGDQWLEQEHVAQAQRRFHCLIDGRYRGQTHDIRVALQAGAEEAQDAFTDGFHRAHKAQHGHAHPDRPIEIVNCRLQAVGLVVKAGATAWQPTRPTPVWDERDVYFDKDAGWMRTRVYDRASLPSGLALAGPVIIEEMSSTTVVLPGQTATIDEAGNIRIRV
ncbi:MULTISPECIES: hydantoinase/oxoprolinase family protein [unclassified Achromobacter]|uniref:hydantoinase/oxoprolinase family protein n=1 Tax=unclassified Achromobacter TaxID=2626865 RepID=UPI000B515B2C|nr:MULTISPECIES: hydantoinase/oxoprolinase family protein [unclassified Achromobacter]OWT71446.1 5-oxoprolinase [Achromobacter sp. HZ34]OWT73103.1 5-oxoprolinase [Achromobacter sp. HZ28]